MAKKKGLASLVKAPRNTTIKGQPHMLAYITGSEADILKRLGGAGDPGPMGIPSFFYDEVGAVSDTTGTTGSGGQSQNFSSGDTDSSDDSGGDNNNQSDNKPVEDSGASQYRPGAGTYSKQAIQDIPGAAKTGLEGFIDRLFGGSGGLSESAAKEYYQRRIEDGPVDPDTGMSRRQSEALDALANQYGRAQTGLLGKIPGVLGSALNKISTMNIEKMTEAIQRGGTPVFDAKGNVTRVDMPGGGFYGRAPDTFSTDSGDDSPSVGGALQAGAAAPATTPAVTPDAYYQRGVGASTMDLADATQRDAFLAGLYGQTPSPIGTKFDKEKGLLYLQDGSVIDIKTGEKIKEKRISGLDIFKPLQTYAK